jgi:hypothetical protein
MESLHTIKLINGLPVALISISEVAVVVAEKKLE